MQTILEKTKGHIETLRRTLVHTHGKRLIRQFKNALANAKQMLLNDGVLKRTTPYCKLVSGTQQAGLDETYRELFLRGTPSQVPGITRFISRHYFFFPPFLGRFGPLKIIKMKTDTLRQLVTEVEHHCTAKELITFHGTLYPPESFTIAEWNRNEAEDWKLFLFSAEKMGVKTIHIDQTVCALDPEQLDTISRAVDLLDKAFKPAFTDMLNTLTQHNGEVVEVSLSFVAGKISYTYLKQADWYEAFETLVKVNEDDSAPDEESTPAENSPLDRKEVEKAVQEIISSQEFTTAEFDKELFQVVFRYWSASGSNDRLFLNGVWLRVQKAFKEKVASECREKIRLLREENPTITKVAVAGITGLSLTKVGQYWGATKI